MSINCRLLVCFDSKSIWTFKEKISHGIQAALVTLFFAWFFYRSIWMSVFLIPIGLFLLKMQYEEALEKRSSMIRVQFKDVILGIASNLKAGYAVENAFRESYQEICMLYGKDAPICKGIYRILQGLENNLSIETLMERFAKETGIEDIQEFADIFRIAKKSGGNLSEIIYTTASTISEKVEVDQEIEVLIAAKQFEQKIMNIIPFAIVLYVSAASKGYFDVLYNSLAGNIVMTVCLTMYIASYCLGKKIIQIHV